MADADDQRWMALALSLGRRGLGQTWPNPAVGCVIVKNGRVLGRGWTQAGGRPHAERMALDQAEPCVGAVAYVSLEPCAHTGKTPPCANALIAARVARVVVALGDPDPRVAGRGIEMLRAAGIAVETGVCEAEARRDQQGFLMRINAGRPMVTLKLASSFDGRIATAQGESQWITGTQARARVQELRASHDAVMVGGNTARKDFPSLTLRGMPERRQPVRIVVSEGLQLPDTGPLATDTNDAPVWLIHGPNPQPASRLFWTDRQANLIEVPHAQDGGGLDMAAALQALGAQGITRVLCEGGGQLAASLLRAGLVDRIVGFTAGVMLGGDALPSLGLLGLGALAEAPRFVISEQSQIGDDIMHVWHCD